MNFIIWLVVGGVLGWLASIVMKTDRQQGIFLNIVVGVVGAFIPSLAKWVDWAWYKLSEVMGWVMSRVMLSLVFFVFLFPVALLSRVFGK